MKYAMDVKVNLEPIFSSFVHTDWWEGPCCIGPMEEGTPEFKRRVGKKQFKIWYEELQNNLDLTRCNLMDPVYVEFDESFMIRDSELDRLMPENHQVGLYLITYRIPGIEHLNKPVFMINLGPTPIDPVGYYRDVGLEAYMVHNYEEYNRILICLRVCKAVTNTKTLILSNSRQTPVSVNTGCRDLTSPFTRYGIRHNCIDFRQVFSYFDGIPTDEGAHRKVRTLMKGTDRVDITKEYLCSDLRYFHAVRRMMKRYDRNAFITLYKELCTDRPLQKNKCVPCIAHSLNKDDGIPSACEEDLAVWIAMIMTMCLTRRSMLMGNLVLVLAENRALEQLGILKLLTQSDQVFNHDVLEVHHAVPVHRICGSDRPEQKYEPAYFTTQDWGAHYHVDMVEEEGQVVTFGRFNRQGTRIMVAVGHILGCKLRPIYCNPAVYHEVEGGTKKFRQALARGSYGHHQVIIYGNHVKELQELDEIVGFEVEVSH